MNGIQLIQEHMFKFKHQLQSVLGACYVLCWTNILQVKLLPASLNHIIL